MCINSVEVSFNSVVVSDNKHKMLYLDQHILNCIQHVCHKTFSSLLFSSTSRPLSVLPLDQPGVQVVSQVVIVCGSAQERFTRSSSIGGILLAPST